MPGLEFNRNMFQCCRVPFVKLTPLQSSTKCAGRRCFIKRRSDVRQSTRPLAPQAHLARSPGSASPARQQISCLLRSMSHPKGSERAAVPDQFATKPVEVNFKQYLVQMSSTPRMSSSLIIWYSFPSSLTSFALQSAR